jgi:threonylcarbamoyladenosine tRNA methylthiotransferase MtaB
MKRNYNVSDFVRHVSDLKKKIKGFSFSTDIIVGFPGETEEEFQQTVKTIKKLKKMLGKSFIHVHVFRYSSRKGTTAAKMLGKPNWKPVLSKEKKRRSKIIRKLINNTALCQ